MTYTNVKDYIVPTRPYMIALGTSHTNGDCMTADDKAGHVSQTAYEKIADELGLELVNVGLSGCTNSDLLQATNELLYHGFLNSSLCKLFVLEPRISSGSAYLPMEIIDNQHDHTKTTSVGTIKGWGRTRYNNRKDITCTRQQVSSDVRIIDFNNPAPFVANWESPNNEKLAIKSAMEYFTFYAATQHELFDNITIINAIRSIVESNNIKFKWQAFMGVDGINNMKQIYKEDNYFWDTFINLFGKEIRDKVGMPWLENKTVLNPYFCECSHLSDLGHIEWYKNTIPYLKEIMREK